MGVGGRVVRMLVWERQDNLVRGGRRYEDDSMIEYSVFKKLKVGFSMLELNIQLMVGRKDKSVELKMEKQV